MPTPMFTLGSAKDSMKKSAKKAKKPKKVQSSMKMMKGRMGKKPHQSMMKEKSDD